MSNQLNLDTDVKKLTQTQLDELRQMCWDKDSEISKEVDRRASMPFILETELASIRTIRSAMKNEPKPFAEWKRPTSIVDAYIIGDSVTYNGKKYLAQGQGALMYAPDEVDPIQGVYWHEYVDGVDADPVPNPTPDEPRVIDHEEGTEGVAAEATGLDDGAA